MSKKKVANDEFEQHVAYLMKRIQNKIEYGDPNGKPLEQLKEEIDIHFRRLEIYGYNIEE